MKIRRFFGKDMREALRLVKEELGSEAVIMSNRKVADGIELVAAYDKEPHAAIKTAQAKLAQTAQAAKQNAAKTEKPLPTLSEIIGDDGPDTLRALLEKQAQQAGVNEPNQQAPQESVTKPRESYASAPQSQSRSDRGYQAKPAPTSLYEESFAEGQNSSGHRDGSELADIKAEIASLRDVLQFQLSDMNRKNQNAKRPLQSYLCEQLIGMGLSETLAEQLVSYTPAQCNEREAWVYLLKLLSNRLHVNGDDILSYSGVVALVGPTGTGKTTTIAKLAAKYAQKYGVEQVAMITIDTYRIAAFEQLATYGKIIGCPVRKAQSAEELSDLLFQLRHKRLVLIDTAGFSQRDSRLISQLAAFEQDRGQKVKKYLVAQANTQYSSLQRVIDAYNEIELDGCIITKVDECYSLGEVVSCAIERQLSVSYVTDGQQVPEDIKVAEAKSIISTAAKLYKKYGLNHTNGNSMVNAARAV